MLQSVSVPMEMSSSIDGSLRHSDFRAGEYYIQDYRSYNSSIARDSRRCSFLHSIFRIQPLDRILSYEVSQPVMSTDL